MKYNLIILFLILFILLLLFVNSFKRKNVIQHNIETLVNMNENEIATNTNNAVNNAVSNNLNTAEKINTMNQNVSLGLNAIINSPVYNLFTNFNDSLFDGIKSSALPLLSIDNLINIKKILDKIGNFISNSDNSGISNYLNFLIILKQKEQLNK